jgi:hypothetical protein
MEKLSLEEFIYQVKHELLDAQQKHAGEDAYFDLKQVELEASVTATKSADGGISIKVVSVGGSLAKERVHTVKLTFGVPPIPSETETGGGPKRPRSGSGSGGGGASVRRGGYKYR